jgi:hypothetical protein
MMRKVGYLLWLLIIPIGLLAQVPAPARTPAPTSVQMRYGDIFTGTVLYRHKLSVTPPDVASSTFLRLYVGKVTRAYFDGLTFRLANDGQETEDFVISLEKGQFFRLNKEVKVAISEAIGNRAKSGFKYELELGCDTVAGYECSKYIVSHPDLGPNERFKVWVRESFDVARFDKVYLGELTGSVFLPGLRGLILKSEYKSTEGNAVIIHVLEAAAVWSGMVSPADLEIPAGFMRTLGKTQRSRYTVD